jgi:hypothetical protein
MSEADENRVEIIESSIKGTSGIVILMRGQPGNLAITAYTGDKPVTIVVSTEELRAAIDRLSAI